MSFLLSYYASHTLGNESEPLTLKQPSVCPVIVSIVNADDAHAEGPGSGLF